MRHGRDASEACEICSTAVLGSCSLCTHLKALDNDRQQHHRPRSYTYMLANGKWIATCPERASNSCILASSPPPPPTKSALPHRLPCFHYVPPHSYCCCRHSSTSSTGVCYLCTADRDVIPSATGGFIVVRVDKLRGEPPASWGLARARAGPDSGPVRRGRHRNREFQAANTPNKELVLLVAATRAGEMDRRKSDRWRFKKKMQRAAPGASTAFIASRISFLCIHPRGCPLPSLTLVLGFAWSSTPCQ